MVPLVDEFRTLNWVKIKSDMEFYRVFEVFPSLVLQN